MLKKSIITLLFAVFLLQFFCAFGTEYAGAAVTMFSKTIWKDGIGKTPAHAEFTFSEECKGLLRAAYDARGEGLIITITDRKGVSIQSLRFANVKVKGGLVSVQGNKMTVGFEKSGDTYITADVVRTGSFRGEFYCLMQVWNEPVYKEQVKPGGYFYDPVETRIVAFYPGSKKMAVDGKTVAISDPAVYKDGVAYVPLRAAVEAFGGKVAVTNRTSKGYTIEASFTDLRRVSTYFLDGIWYGYDNDGKKIGIPYKEHLWLEIRRALRPGELPYIPENDIMRSHLVKLSAPIYVSQKGNVMVPARVYTEAMGIKVEISKGFPLSREKIVLSNINAV